MITHQVSTVPVFQTDNYKLFDFIDGNRPLNENKIKRIIKEIESGNDMLKYCPIQIKMNKDNTRMKIFDGQHRFFISKKLKRPIYYIIITEEKTMSDIARVNSNVEKWTAKNFVNCYAVQGNKNYIKLKEFIDTYGINFGTSLRLLAFGTPGVEGSNASLNEKFEEGKFEVLKWDEAILIADKCQLFKDFKYWRDRAFVIAIFRIMKAGKVSIADVHEAYNKYPDMLVKNFSYKNYIYNLEQVVNNKKHHRISIL